MRIEIGSKGVGGRNESWFYLETSESGDHFYVHEWNNQPFNGPIEKGEKRIPLNDAAGKPFYAEAVRLAQKR